METNDRFYLLLKSVKRVPEKFGLLEQKVQYAVHSNQVISRNNEVGGSSGSETSSDEECLPNPTDHMS